ncbi:MAG: 23S rRNA (adenine(1618)-N(6))-methyltransferase RlmF [Bacteroidota bacterium]
MPPNPPIKPSLHPRNKNRERYDLEALLRVKPELAAHIKPNKHGAESIDFAQPAAVKLLNQALLHHYYGIAHWDFPDENLCPPIPGRADYLHYVADLLAEGNDGNIPTGDQIKCLDVGVGASAIYPIIGVVEYGWHFIGSDTDDNSLASAQKIVEANKALQGKIELCMQTDRKVFFKGVLSPDDKIDLTLCNPPFHASMDDARKGTRRKVRNLSGQQTASPTLNFSGSRSELVYAGGEARFIQKMARESQHFAEQCLWFTTLVSKQVNLKPLYTALKKAKALEVKTIPMGTGNKSTRIVAWTFLTPEAQQAWRESRWQ